MIKLVDNNASAGISEFQWSTSEQTWPFEKASDGSTLYCKELVLGTLPNTGTLATAHGLGNSVANKIFNIQIYSYASDNVNGIPVPYSSGTSYLISWQCSGANLEVYTNFNATYYANAKARLVYRK